MPRLKRPVFLFFTCQDHPFLDVEQLLRGVVEPSALRRVYGLSAAVGGAVPLTEDELQLILSLPSDDWVESDDPRMEALADRGLILRNGDDPVDGERRRRDELLAETGWNPYAALFHFLTRWQGVDLRAWAPGDEPPDELPPVRREDLEQFVAERGPPPPAFHPREPSGRVTELPLVDGVGAIFELLPKRKTTRAFDEGRALFTEELSILLRSVFGVHGSATALPGVVTLKRTSPSGRGLSPRGRRRRACARAVPVPGRAACPRAARSARILTRRAPARDELHVGPDVFRLGPRARRDGRALRAEPLEVQRARQGLSSNLDGRRPSQPDALPRGGGDGPRRIRHRSRQHGGRR